MRGENVTDPNFFSRIWNRITARKELLESIRDRDDRISELERANRELTDALAGSEKRAAEHSGSESALRGRVSELERANRELTDAVTGSEKQISEERQRAAELLSRISELDHANRELTGRLDKSAGFADEQKKYIGELKEHIAGLDKEKQRADKGREEMFAACAGLFQENVSDGRKIAGLQSDSRLFRKVYPAALSLIRERDRILGNVEEELRKCAETIRFLMDQLRSAGGSEAGVPCGPDPESDRVWIAASGLFDRAWYLSKNPDVRESGVDPLTHFMESGWREGRDPSPLFRISDYRSRHPEIPAEVNPLLHFLNEAFRMEQLGSAPAAVTALPRFLVRESGLFDRAWYLSENPDVREAGVDPLMHFMESGWREGRDPSDRFSLREYLELNPDLRGSGIMPLVHFLQYGISEGRSHLHRLRESELFRVLHYLDMGPRLCKPGAVETAVSPDFRVGVFLHLDRPGMEDWAIRILRRLPCPFDLFLSFRSSSGHEAGPLTERFRKSLDRLGKIETAFSGETTGADLLLGDFGAGLETYDAVFFPVPDEGPGAHEDVSAEKQAAEVRFILSRLAAGVRLVLPPSSLGDDPAEDGEDETAAVPVWLQRQLEKTSGDPEHEQLLFFMRSSGRALSGAGIWMRGNAVKTLRTQALHRIGAAEAGGHRLSMRHLVPLAPLLTLPAGGQAEILFRADVPLDVVRFDRINHLMESSGALLKELLAPGPELVLVSHAADHSGAPMTALSLARELKCAGMSFLVVLLKDGCLRPEFEECGPVRVIPADVLKELPAQESAVPRRVLLNTVISGALAPSFRSAGFRVVTLIHEMGDSIRDNGWKWFAQRTLSGSGRIVMPSTVVSESWARIGCPVSGEQLRIQPQGNYCRSGDGEPLDREDCRKRVFGEFGLPEGSKLVLSASAFLERRKGVSAFLDTAEIFRRNGEDDVFFLWLGDDPHSVLLEPDIAGRMKDGGHCLFPGFRPDLAPYMAAADVFFLPSLADPFPTVVLQAADQGTPVVLCGSCTGCSDFCRNFEAGMVTEYSAESFAGEIGKLIRDPALRDRVSEQLLSFSRSYPSPERYLRTVLDLFENPDGGTVHHDGAAARS